MLPRSCPVRTATCAGKNAPLPDMSLPARASAIDCEGRAAESCPGTASRATSGALAARNVRSPQLGSGVGMYVCTWSPKVCKKIAQNHQK